MSSFKEVIDRFKIPLGLGLLGTVLILGGLLAPQISSQKKEFPKESVVSANKQISVDISGAVVKSGVYQLSEGARVEDVLKAAGGLTDQANQQYVAKSLNLAQKLVDGSKIYIPSEDEAYTGLGQTTGSVAGASTNSSQVNINSATQVQLEALPGVGAVTAGKIISGRPYQSVDELVSKKIVGKAVYERIKDLVVVY